MVILGLERPVEYGSRLIFDPTMANMVLNALNNYIQAMKDDYLRGREDLKEFNKNFGDFFSPILKDMEWYDLNVTGATRDLINNLYAQGMDLRNPEFRAAISRWIGNMPVGKINLLKQSAADANEYLKNKAVLQSKGLWNPEFEKMVLGGRSLEDWDTNKYGMWTRTSPAEYKDLNLFTTHIFDALKDSYIGTDKDHYDWYGITPEQMMQSLTPDTIGGLLNSDLGRFHYNNARNDLLRQGIANPTDAQIMQQFKNNIVAANNEKTHRDRRINELWKMLQEHNSRMRAARASRPGPDNNSQNNLWSFAELVRRSGPTAIVGQQVQKYSDETLKKQLDEQMSFGKLVTKATDSKSYSNKGISMYKGKYGQNIYRRSDIVDYFVSMGYKPTEDGMSIVIPKKDINKFSSLKSLASRTAGYRSVNVNTQTKDLNDADIIVYTPSGNSYQAFMKNSRNEAHFEGTVRLIKYKRGDVTGELVRDTKNNPVLDTDNIKQQTLYFDSDIKSVKNDSRLGYLNAPKKQSIVNTQDSRYQNAINADKDVTDKIIKNTVYGSDAILSEEPGYANIP